MGPRLGKCKCARVEEVQGVGDGAVQRHGGEATAQESSQQKGVAEKEF